MAKRRYKAEKIVPVLRQVEVSIAKGKATPQACRESGIAEQTYYRWRKEYGGLKLADFILVAMFSTSSNAACAPVAAVIRELVP